jgi:hypothetical protein
MMPVAGQRGNSSQKHWKIWELMCRKICLRQFLSGQCVLPALTGNITLLKYLSIFPAIFIAHIFPPFLLLVFFRHFATSFFFVLCYT